MHAVVVRAAISDLEQGKAALERDVLPRVRSMPGFVAGYWLEPKDGQGVSFVLFQDEEAAREASKMVEPGAKPTPFATVETMEIRGVVAQA
jgi:hypothetical protein